MRLKRTILKETSSRLFISGSLLLIITFFHLPAAAQNVKLVRFVYGKTRIVFSDTANLGQVDTYLIKLRKGQTYQIEIEWKGEDMTNEPLPLRGYTVIVPMGREISNPPSGVFQPPVTGIYKIVVSPLTTRTDYRYRITFIKNQFSKL
jgi:hypothetical protein